MNKVINYINTNLSIDDEYYDIFGKQIPQGKMFCPFHDNINTPAAKRYGNVIHCFSCNKTYSVYDLLRKYHPERITEIKSSLIIDDVEDYSKKSDYLVKQIDRSKSIDVIIRSILK